MADEKKETQKVVVAEKKKSPVTALVIGVVILAAAGAGIWFAVGSKSKTEPVSVTPEPTTQLPTPPAPTVRKTAPADNGAEQAQINTLAAYREAMKNGQAALDQQDYAAAAEAAEAALQKVPNDAAAAKLRDSAQKLTGDYNQAVAQAQAAYQRGDYAGAMSQADLALSLRKNDAAMQNLKTDAGAQAKMVAAYRDALKNAQGAFDGRDYKNAAAWAAVALQKIPSDAAATKLQENAQRQLAAISELDRKYQAANQASQEAFKAGNYALAAAKVKEALQFKPNDLAATQQAKLIQANMDFEAARQLFNQGAYDDVTKACSVYPGVEAFVQLEKNNEAEQASLAAAQQQFNAGDYSFVSQLAAQSFGQKQPFAGLLNQAAGERKLLADLESLRQSTNWQAVVAKLADPANASAANKAPFRSLSQWAKNYVSHAEREKDYQQLNITYEKMLVWFNIKNPSDPYIQTPEARKESRRDGSIGEQRDQYLKLVDWLESEYKRGGWLEQNDRAKNLKDLKNTISHRD